MTSVSLASALCRATDIRDPAATRATFGPYEREHCVASRRLDRTLGRVAARTAVSQALIQAAEYSVADIEVRPHVSGRPEVFVDGCSVDPLADMPATKRTPRIVVTISHESDCAAALALVCRQSERHRLWVGIDLVHRSWARPVGWIERLRRHILTPDELTRDIGCDQDSLQFAIGAKESVGKALKWRVPHIRWRDVELGELSAGSPRDGNIRDVAVIIERDTGWPTSAHCTWLLRDQTRAVAGHSVSFVTRRGQCVASVVTV